MPNSLDPFHERLFSGADPSLPAKLLRAALATIEPAYATLMRARNFAYDHHLKKIHRLPLPTISVGNLTTGGTGKTPVIRWLAEHFIRQNLRPAILMRGYRSESTGGSDEQRMLQSYLGDKAIVVANPDRRAGAQQAMQQSPKPDLFLLDDAFQHRKIHRDFNLLLINATNPFGHNHVLPRGYLREPITGIQRAHAIVITRADQVPDAALSNLKSQLARLAPTIPLYQSSHAHASFLHNTTHLKQLPPRYILFSGIANPTAFYAQFPSPLAIHTFPDHHAYTQQDLITLQQSAAQHAADILITTEKDFVKLSQFPSLTGLPPIYRAQLHITFANDDETRLLAQISAALKPPSSAPSPAPSAPASST